MLKKCDLRNKNVLYLIFMFLFWAFIYFNVPIGHDDWHWGSRLGIESLQNKFMDLNGRYLGSLLTLALTRNTIIRISIMTALTGLIIVLMAKVIIDEKEEKQELDKIMIIGCVLVLFTPRDIYKQTFSWISGFANYIPPIFLLLIYLCSIKNLFLGKFVQDKRKTSIVKFLLIGICSQLFMEHMTLYAVVLSISVLGYSYFRYKKISYKDISYCVGVICGTVIMFTNPAYYSIMNNADVQEYRTVQHGGIITIFHNAVEQYCRLLNKEYLMEMIVAITLLSVLTIVSIYKSKNLKMDLICKASAAVVIWYPIYLIYVKCYTPLLIGDPLKKYVAQGIFTLAYYAALVIIFMKTIEDKNILQYLIFLIVSIWVFIAPLTVVTPVAGRNMLASYIFLCLIIMQLTSYLKICESNILIDYTIVSSQIVMVLIFVVIFRSIGVDARFRDREIRKQIANNETTIVVPSIRHAEYLQIGNPAFSDGYNPVYAFRAYYNLDESIKVEND